jgi:hypothetical protein
MKLDPSNLEKFVNQHINEWREELEREGLNEHIEALSQKLQSSEALEFTQRMNKYFAKEDLKDEDGNPIRIQHPHGFASRISWDSSGKSAFFDMTEEEDRWFRADALYGNNILKELGFKYTNR